MMPEGAMRRYIMGNPDTPVRIGVDMAADDVNINVLGRARMGELLWGVHREMYAMQAITMDVPYSPAAEALIRAEALLRRGLPDDLYLRLCATGKFQHVTAENGVYTLSKTEKTTLMTPTGNLFSCCVEMPGCPPADRVLGEYMLIKNDEKKYLETANLTQISERDDDLMRKAVECVQALELALLINRFDECGDRRPGVVDTGEVLGNVGESMRHVAQRLTQHERFSFTDPRMPAGDEQTVFTNRNVRVGVSRRFDAANRSWTYTAHVAVNVG